MSHVPMHAMAGGTMLLLVAALARAAEAQDPRTQPQTSAVQRLGLDTTPAPGATGHMRELRCRGKPGIDLRIHQAPSPRYPHLVTLALRYEPVKPTRSVGQEGMGLVDYGVSLALLPGMCTWRYSGSTDITPEPGIVYFDVPRDGQAWAAPGMRDTTIDGAAKFPDLPSLQRYLGDPDRYWVFYVDDATNVSISFGRLGAQPPTASGPAPAPAPAGSVGGPLRGGKPNSASTVRTGASLPGSRRGDASTSRTLLPDVRIWGVATAPGSRGVRLVFNTDRASAAFGTNGIGVQFSSQRPPWDSVGGRWAYPAGWDSPWYAEISHPADGGYLAEPRGKLEVRQRYYYLITVESNDRSLPPRQVVGSFIASTNPFAKAPPAPGPDPTSNDDFGDPLRGNATEVAGTLRDQRPGATTATGTTTRPGGPGAAQSTGPGISRTRLPPDVRIWNIETKPGNSGVTLSFQTDRVWVRSSSGVRVQFSTQQPRWEGGLLASPAVESRAREVVSGWFEAEPHWTLQAGKRYYYLITVDSNDGTLRPRQATGSFLPAFGP